MASPFLTAGQAVNPSTPTQMINGKLKEFRAKLDAYIADLSATNDRFCGHRPPQAHTEANTLGGNIKGSPGSGLLDEMHETMTDIERSLNRLADEAARYAGAV